MSHEGKKYKTRSIFLMSRETHVMFTQIKANKGIEQIGKCAVDALVKEFKQLDKRVLPGKPVLCSINLNTLAKDEN